jgi:hypothetical protein
VLLVLDAFLEDVDAAVVEGVDGLADFLAAAVLLAVWVGGGLLSWHSL